MPLSSHQVHDFEHVNFSSAKREIVFIAVEDSHMYDSEMLLMNGEIDACKKKLAKRFKVFFTIEMLQYLMAGRAAEVAEGC